MQDAVIGQGIRAEFFPEASLPGGQSQDNVAYIPATVFNRIYGPKRTMVLFARARPESGMKLDEALDVTQVALRNGFKTRPGAVETFDTITPASIRELIGQIL